MDNRPAGIIGELVAKAPADGYTLLAVGSVLWLTPFLQDNVGYDPVKDFAPITLTARSVNLLVVHPVAAGELRQGADRAGEGEARAAQLRLGRDGLLQSSRRGIVQVDGRHRPRAHPVQGRGPAVNDLLSGQVQIMFPTTAAGLPHVKSGRLRALAVTSLKPSALAPGLPTVAESGLPGYESIVIYGLFAPAKTPPAIVKRLHAEVAPYLKSPATTERLFNAGVEAGGQLAARAGDAMASEMTRLGKLIKDARIRGE